MVQGFRSSDYQSGPMSGYVPFCFFPFFPFFPFYPSFHPVLPIFPSPSTHFPLQPLQISPIHPVRLVSPTPFLWPSRSSSPIPFITFHPNLVADHPHSPGLQNIQLILARYPFCLQRSIRILYHPPPRSPHPTPRKAQSQTSRLMDHSIVASRSLQSIL